MEQLRLGQRARDLAVSYAIYCCADGGKTALPVAPLRMLNIAHLAAMRICGGLDEANGLLPYLDHDVLHDPTRGQLRQIFTQLQMAAMEPHVLAGLYPPAPEADRMRSAQLQTLWQQTFRRFEAALLNNQAPPERPPVQRLAAPVTARLGTATRALGDEFFRLATTLLDLRQNTLNQQRECPPLATAMSRHARQLSEALQWVLDSEPAAMHQDLKETR